MLTSYSLSCPYENCDWTGSLVPSLLRGGKDAEIPSWQQAWFRCPGCQRDWHVTIRDDRITILPAVQQGV